MTEKIKHSKDSISCIIDQIDIYNDFEGTPPCCVCGEDAENIHTAYKGNITMGGFLCDNCLPEKIGIHPYFDQLVEGMANVKIKSLL